MSRTDPRSEANWIQIQQDEHELILRRRQAVARVANYHPADESDIQSDASPSSGKSDAVPLDKSLVGLAFSGGGVRSGAFNLGLSQALHDKNVLPQIDYLSTVSGGGYAGAHLTSLGCNPESRFG
jgi:predicted acylesterase/phospholipase RssA